jgi:CheY-like chemotaxis protein
LEFVHEAAGGRTHSKFQIPNSKLQKSSAAADNPTVRTLLVADQSVTIRRVIELTFADQDVRVVAVADGNRAIERLEAAPPDIVLADASMPGRDGYEVARYVKQSPRLSHIPVLLLAGAFESIDRHRAEEAGCDGFLAKPLEPQLVVSRVQELLGRTHSVAAPREGDTGVAARVEELDEYFDRLDAAFANRLRGSADPVAPDAPAASAPASIDQTAGEQADTDSADAGAAGDSAASTPVPGPALPGLADAFAALLAAEGHEQAANDDASSGGPAADLVDQVTRRVLAHLSENVVRETVTAVVTEVAERLVREEIERIKAAIK